MNRLFEIIPFWVKLIFYGFAFVVVLFGTITVLANRTKGFRVLKRKILYTNVLENILGRRLFYFVQAIYETINSASDDREIFFRAAIIGTKGFCFLNVILVHFDKDDSWHIKKAFLRLPFKLKRVYIEDVQETEIIDEYQKSEVKKYGRARVVKVILIGFLGIFSILYVENYFWKKTESYHFIEKQIIESKFVRDIVGDSRFVFIKRARLGTSGKLDGTGIQSNRLYWINVIGKKKLAFLFVEISKDKGSDIWQIDMVTISTPFKKRDITEMFAHETNVPRAGTPH